MNPTVVFANLRPYPREHRRAVAAAQGLGLDVVLLADKEPVDAADLSLRELVLTETRDAESFDAAVDGIARRHDVVGITTWTDRDVVSVSRAAARLGLPGVPPEAAETCRNKFRMREVAQRHPGSVTTGMLVPDAHTLREAAERVGFPAVLKPTSLSGSTGVFLVKDEAQAAAAYERLTALVHGSASGTVERTPHGILFERYVDGPEFSVEGVVSRGAVSVFGVTAKETSQEYFLEVGHLHPAPIDPPLTSRVEEFTRWVVRETGMDDCAFHLECRVAPGGEVQLIEVAARIGGGYITSHLVPLATGVDVYRESLRVVTGSAPETSPSRRAHAGVRKIVAPTAGRFEGVRGVDAAAALEGVEVVDITRATGSTIVLPPDNFASCLLGSVIAAGPTAEDVRAVLGRAGELLVPVMRS